MRLRLTRQGLLVGLIIMLFFGVSLYLRAVLPSDVVFGTKWVKFTSNDAYYHMRLVDSMVHNFPHILKWDYYLLYPGVTGLGDIHFFQWLIAAVIWVIGLGSPSQHLIDVAGAYYPAVLGALAVFPVYFIGKELFHRGAGVLAAGLIAIIPGEFLGRSILGFTDNHVAEVLFTTTTMLFLILAVKSARQKGVSLGHLLRWDWPVLRRPLGWSFLAGLSLGIYLITWAGALLFVFIIAVYLIIQFILDYLQGESTDYLALVGFIVFLLALVIFAPSSPGRLFTAALIIALLLPVLLSAVARLVTARGLKPAYYPLALLGAGVVGLVVFYAVAPALVGSMLSQFGIFFPQGASRTTLEMQPLLSPVGSFTFRIAWGNFTTGFFLSLGLIVYWIFYRRIYRRQPGGAAENLLLVWSVVILAAALGQRRFAYYFAVNVAVLTGYISWQVIWNSGLRQLAARSAEALERTRAIKKKGKPDIRRHPGPRVTVHHVSVFCAVIVVFFFIFFFDIRPAVTVAGNPQFAPSNAWYQALDWMREGTPEPFGDPAFYDELYDPGSYVYPETAYGVMSWWDYGYWITRVARRVPNANPSQPPQAITSIANFFLSQDEAAARNIIDELGSLYVVIDDDTARSKFWAVVTWAGQNPDEYFSNYYVRQEGKLTAVTLFTPEYYQSMCVRLYNFDGKAVTQVKPIVIGTEERTDPQGRRYQEITYGKDFPTYNEAVEYVRSQNSPKFRVVGGTPFISAVPLEAVSDYRLDFSSTFGEMQSDVGLVPEVKVFKYIGGSR